MASATSQAVEAAKSMEYTDTATIGDLVTGLHRSFQAGKSLPYTWRMQQLKQIKLMIQENWTAWMHALSADLGRPAYESKLYDLEDVVNQVDYFLRHLKSFMQPQPKGVQNQLRSYGHWQIMREPFGTVLIISPWNYPVQLLFNPLVGAIAAGNTAILKPSEVTSQTAGLIGHLVPKYLDPEAVRVVLGGVPETTELLKHKFEHIMYTGSSSVGKVVMAAAAKHLTPVTLELGGKCPVYVHKSCDIGVTARRLIWGKANNAGQICMAPDYALVDREVQDRLISALKKELHRTLGDDPASSGSYGRIVNANHIERLAGFLKEEHGGEVLLGGSYDKQGRYFSPTIILNPDGGSKLMSEEVFGPILALRTVTAGLEEAIELINSKEAPLAAYLFAADKQVQQTFMQKVYAGGMCINDVIGHYFNLETTFGGKGASGMGGYRGRASFDTFSHHKTVCVAYTSTDWMLYPLRYAPYTEFKAQVFGKMLSANLEGISTVLKTVKQALCVCGLLALIHVFVIPLDMFVDKLCDITKLQLHKR